MTCRKKARGSDGGAQEWALSGFPKLTRDVNGPDTLPIFPSGCQEPVGYCFQVRRNRTRDPAQGKGHKFEPIMKASSVNLGALGSSEGSSSPTVGLPPPATATPSATHSLPPRKNAGVEMKFVRRSKNVQAAQLITESLRRSQQELEGEKDALREVQRDLNLEITPLDGMENSMKHDFLLDNTLLQPWEATLLPGVRQQLSFHLEELELWEPEVTDERIISHRSGKMIYRNSLLTKCSIKSRNRLSIVTESFSAFLFHVLCVLFVCLDAYSWYFGYTNYGPIWQSVVLAGQFIAAKVMMLILFFGARKEFRLTRTDRKFLDPDMDKRNTILISKELVYQMSRIVSDLSQTAQSVSSRIETNLANVTQVNIPRELFSDVMRGTGLYLKLKFSHDKLMNPIHHLFRPRPVMQDAINLDIELMRSLDIAISQLKRAPNSTTSTLLGCLSELLLPHHWAVSLLVLVFLPLIQVTYLPKLLALPSGWEAVSLGMTVVRWTSFLGLLTIGLKTISSLCQLTMISVSLPGFWAHTIPVNARKSLLICTLLGLLILPIFGIGSTPNASPSLKTNPITVSSSIEEFSLGLTPLRSSVVQSFMQSKNWYIARNSLSSMCQCYNEQNLFTTCLEETRRLHALIWKPIILPLRNTLQRLSCEQPSSNCTDIVVKTCHQDPSCAEQLKKSSQGRIELNFETFLATYKHPGCQGK